MGKALAMLQLWQLERRNAIGYVESQSNKLQHRQRISTCIDYEKF